MKQITVCSLVTLAVALCLAFPASADTNYIVIQELISFVTADGGTNPIGSDRIFGHVIEGDTAYAQLTGNNLPQITRIDDVSGSQDVTQLVSPTAWMVATEKTIMSSWYGMSLWSNYIQFADSSSDQIWRFDKNTGEIICYADTLAISNATGSADIKITARQGVNPFTGEHVFYEGESDNILITAGSNVVAVYLSSNDMISAFGNCEVRGGMTYDPDGNFYFACRHSDADYSAVQMRATNGALSTVLTKAQIETVVTNRSTFGDIFYAPDGLIYFVARSGGDCNILSFDPHDPGGTLAMHLSEDDLTNSVAQDANIHVLGWYDNGEYGGITWNNGSGRYPIYWAEQIPEAVGLIALLGVLVATTVRSRGV